VILGDEVGSRLTLERRSGRSLLRPLRVLSTSSLFGSGTPRGGARDGEHDRDGVGSMSIGSPRASRCGGVLSRSRTTATFSAFRHVSLVFSDQEGHQQRDEGGEEQVASLLRVDAREGNLNDAK